MFNETTLTPTDYLTCTDNPFSMISYLQLCGFSNDRSFLLYTCAVARRFPHLTNLPRERILELGETLVDEPEITQEIQDLVEQIGDYLCDDQVHANSKLIQCARSLNYCLSSKWRINPWGVAKSITDMYLNRDNKNAVLDEQKARVKIIRCIFEDPVNPPSRVIDPSLFEGRVKDMAQEIYKNNNHLLLPILAELCEESGITHPAVLAHCRSKEPHYKGCWVIDMILGHGVALYQPEVP